MKEAESSRSNNNRFSIFRNTLFAQQEMTPLPQTKPHIFQNRDVEVVLDHTRNYDQVNSEKVFEIKRGQSCKKKRIFSMQKCNDLDSTLPLGELMNHYSNERRSSRKKLKIFQRYSALEPFNTIQKSIANKYQHFNQQTQKAGVQFNTTYGVIQKAAINQFLPNTGLNRWSQRLQTTPFNLQQQSFKPICQAQQKEGIMTPQQFGILIMKTKTSKRRRTEERKTSLGMPPALKLGEGMGFPQHV